LVTPGQTSFALVGAASIAAATLGSPLAAIIIVFEMTGSYEGAVLSMLSVSLACLISRSFIGRSLFDRQILSRGIILKDDHI
jgi:CIC family chloride channel protein